jgi:hypothetical protein
MEVNGQHQAPPLLTEQEAGWGTEYVPKSGKYERYLSRKGIKRRFFCCSTRTLSLWPLLLGLRHYEQLLQPIDIVET